ncbi:DinB family protein [Jatrophihabitans fulvus]
MTDSPEPTSVLQALRASTADLLKGLDELGWSDADVRAPSRCAGWTRAHVLSHLARNADGITATLSGALRGEIEPRYPDGDAGRDRDIESGAGRPATELRADVADTAERLDRVLGAVLDAEAWDAPTDDGRVARDWLPRRLREVEIHRVDLDADYEPDRWPPALVHDLLPDAMESVPHRTSDALHIVVGQDGSICPELVGREWTIGAGTPVELTGPDWALAAWATGRGDLVAHRLGATPALEPWR